MFCSLAVLPLILFQTYAMFQMLFSPFAWLKKRRRAKILRTPLSPEAWQAIDQSIPEARGWPENVRRRLETVSRLIVAEKHWEGCDGLQLSDSIQYTIACQAARMLIGVEDYYFDGIHTILVYPEPYEREMREGWIVAERELAGEAWSDGHIIVAWSQVLAGIEQRDGRNVVIHEFAHHIDAISGGFDGQPRLENSSTRKVWRRVTRREYQQLVNEVRSLKPTLLDPYGATNPAEFFAVACEAFFELPELLQVEHPELFGLLRQLFQQDPQRP